MDNGGIDPSDEYGTVVSRLAKLDDDQLATLFQVNVASRITTDLNRSGMLFDAVMAQDGATLATYWRPDRSYLETLSGEALKTLASQIIPQRLIGKVTGGKSDLVEVLAQIIDDAHDGGMRLQESERDVLTAWAPESLGGKAGDDSILFADDNDDGNSAHVILNDNEVGDAIFA